MLGVAICFGELGEVRGGEKPRNCGQCLLYADCNAACATVISNIKDVICMIWTYPVAALAVGAYNLWQNRKKPAEITVREVFQACGVGVRKPNRTIAYPVLRYKENAGAGLRLVYTLPPGISLTDIYRVHEELAVAMSAEVEIELEGRYLVLTVLQHDIPKFEKYWLPEDWKERTREMILPVPIGISRAGLEYHDLAELPHLLVGGETYSGKTTFLLQMLAYLLQLDYCRVHVIDLKKTDFIFLQRHVSLATTTEEAVNKLLWLRREMVRRQDLLAGYEVNNIRYLPQDVKPLYHVLVVDEFSQLCPSLATVKAEKDLRKVSHQCLVDLLCMARSVGIHVVLSMQRPDRDILPGQLKANLPATVAFKTRSTHNSQILLDNNRSFFLPRIRGRAVWRFEHERVVQVMYLAEDEFKAMLPKKPIGSVPEMVELEQNKEAVDGVV